jgi:hypothetical protein
VVEGREAGPASDAATAAALGTALAERLLGQGAAAILAEVREAAVPAVTEP